MITELRKAIYDKLTGNVYFDEAPDGAVMPYTVFSCPSGVHDYDSKDTYPEDTIQISIYGKTLTEIETIEAAIKTAIDRNPGGFSLDDYNVVDITLIFRTQRKVNETYLIILQFKFDLESQ